MRRTSKTSKMMPTTLLLTMTPIQIRRALFNGKTDMDQVRKLPEKLFFKIFPNTQATKNGFLKNPPFSSSGSVQDVYSELFKEAEARDANNTLRFRY
jgi:hypothetical protein